LALKTVLAYHEVADLGASTAGAIVTNTVRTEAQRRRDVRSDGMPATARGPGRLTGLEPLPTLAGPGNSHSDACAGARCTFTEADLEVVFLADDVARVTWGPGPAPFPWALAEPRTLQGSSVRLTGDVEQGVVLESGRMTLHVGPDGALSWRNRAAQVVRRELPPLRRGASRTARFELRDGERVCGLGEQASPADLRGTVHRLWNFDPGGVWGPGQDPLYCSIPVLVGLHPDGDVLAFYENSHDATVRIDPGAAKPAGTPRAELAFAGGVLRHYVICAPLPRLIERYSELTGRAPLPPRWALGYHQCKWGYRNEGDIREVSEGFRTEGLPLSAVYLDIDYMDGYRIFTVDRGAFPDLSGLTGDLARRGTHVVTIIDPGVKTDPGYGVYTEGLAEGRFLHDANGQVLQGVVWPGRVVYPDFTDPGTRRWWAGHYRGLLDQGVAGIWHDMNEPTSITLWGDRTVPMSTKHAAEGRGSDHRECHNVYGQLMNDAGWSAMADHHRGRRPFLLSRAGWAGLQRHSWNWTADIEASWDGLRQQIPTTIGLGLSGVPYTGSDVGGFSGIPSPELYLRWLELSVLMPFCRTHSVTGSPRREPWRFPEPYRSAIGALIRFRYRLLPYFYTLAAEAARTGYPFVRPLSWPPPGAEAQGSSPDARLWKVDDAYFLGDALLVAPATAQGQRWRTVPLPDGRWYRWRAVAPMAAPGGDVPHQDTFAFTGVGDRETAHEVESLHGGSTARLDTPAGQPVVLVRGGSILLLDDGWAAERQAGDDPGWLSPGHEPRLAAWHCFPDDDGMAAGGAHDDAGDGYAGSRTDSLSFEASPDRGAVLRWEHQGAHPLPNRVRVVLHGLGARRVIADGAEVDVAVTRGPGRPPTTSLQCPPFEVLQVDVEG